MAKPNYQYEKRAKELAKKKKKEEKLRRKQENAAQRATGGGEDGVEGEAPADDAVDAGGETPPQ